MSGRLSNLLSARTTRLGADRAIHVEGSVTRVAGITAECRGLSLDLGDLAAIERRDGSELLAEAIGFSGDVTVMMPLSELKGIGPGAHVRSLGTRLTAPAGEQLLGRVIDGLGRPLDGKPGFEGGPRIALERAAPGPAQRRPIREVFQTGVKAIDGLLTIGKGQRIGIFAGAGVGKSTLLGALAARSSAPVTVIGLIGERGREVYDFVRDSLGEKGLQKSVVVAAPSDSPPLERFKAPFTATAIAEWFRDRGQDVLLVMDSLTRFGAAAREVGLALGEPPTAKGYPPSLFSQLPRLVERVGAVEKGSITGIYTVLVEGDDLTDPVADSVRSLIDGHIVLRRTLAERGHYPAIDVLASISRLMSHIATPEHKKIAERFRRLMAIHRDHKDLIDVGAYRAGADRAVDEAISRIGHLDEFLKQDLAAPIDFRLCLAGMAQALGGTR